MWYYSNIYLFSLAQNKTYLFDEVNQFEIFKETLWLVYTEYFARIKFILNKIFVDFELTAHWVKVKEWNTTVFN